MTCTILSDGSELQLACKNEEERPVLEIKKKILGLLESLIYEGYEEFWVNCEYGVPLWTAEFICAMKKDYDLKLHIAVPCEEQSTNWFEEQRDRYFSLHQKADSIKFVNAQFHSGCYQEAAQYMLMQSNALCLFGTPKNHSHIIKIAKEMKKAIYFSS